MTVGRITSFAPKDHQAELQAARRNDSKASAERAESRNDDAKAAKAATSAGVGGKVDITV